MNQCDIVQDLLPLYVDGVCSEASREWINGHTAGCACCAEVLEKLQNSSVEKVLQAEGESVVAHHEKATKRRAFQIGAVMSAILMIPILVCLIVNLATGHGLSWFYIVLTSLMVFGSLTIVPLMTTRRRFSWSLLSFTVSLILLLGVCNAYTHGHWFWVAASSSVFGLSVCFLPIVMRQVRLGGFWGRNKVLFVLLADVLLFVLMMVTIGLYVRSSAFLRTAPVASLYGMVLVAVTVLWFRYAKLGGLIKAGVYTGFFGVYSYCSVPLNNGSPTLWPQVDFSQWNDSTISGNVNFLVMLGCLAVGLILVGIGIAVNRKKRK